MEKHLAKLGKKASFDSQHECFTHPLSWTSHTLEGARLVIPRRSCRRGFLSVERRVEAREALVAGAAGESQRQENPRVLALRP